MSVEEAMNVDIKIVNFLIDYANERFEEYEKEVNNNK